MGRRTVAGVSSSRRAWAARFAAAALLALLYNSVGMKAKASAWRKQRDQTQRGDAGIISGSEDVTASALRRNIVDAFMAMVARGIVNKRAALSLLPWWADVSALATASAISA